MTTQTQTNPDSLRMARMARVLATVTGEVSPDLRPETSLAADLRIDDMDKIEFAMELEAEFGVDLGDADLEQMNTVGDALALVAAAPAEC